MKTICVKVIVMRLVVEAWMQWHWRIIGAYLSLDDDDDDDDDDDGGGGDDDEAGDDDENGVGDMNAMTLAHYWGLLKAR